MRKQCHRRARTPTAPMLVTLLSIPDLELTERLSVEAFVGGWANTDHFDNLADCRDLMTLAAKDIGDKATLSICELGLHAMLGIKQRYDDTERMGATGEELKALRVLCDTSRDFWSRHSGALFKKHYDALKRARKMQAGRKAT